MKENTTLTRILRYISPYRLRVALSLLLALGNVALTLYIPVLVGRVIDSAVSVGEVDFNAIYPLLLRIAVAAVAAAAGQWTITALNNAIVYRVVQDVRKEAYAKLHTLPLSHMDSHRGGDTVSRIITDADIFADGLLIGFSRLFSGIATILGTLVFMLTLSPVIAAVVVVVTPASILVAKFIAGRTHRMFTRQAELRAEQTSLINESIDGFFTVKAAAAEKQIKSRFQDANARLTDCSVKAIFFSSLTNPCTRFVNSIVYALVVLAGGLLCISAYEQADVTGVVTFSVGTLTAFLSYANSYTKPFNEISGVITELQNSFACAKRIFEIIDAPDEQEDAPDAKELHNVRGDVEFKHVSFAYSPEVPLMRDVSFTAHSGQRIAIVGPTGAGKTTLINLLMRFYDVTDGEITVDGINVNFVTRASLRENIGMVLQDTWLKNGTVRENIAMGNSCATDDEILAAAKRAHADGFIRRLPQGYDTVLYGGGSNLSQGQRQLLCIARLMLCPPPLLILDEATSSIDTRTEQKIQAAFGELMRGRTTFIVAHRLVTVREADLILVMDKGDIVELGNHADLIAQHGLYYEMYKQM